MAFTDFLAFPIIAAFTFAGLLVGILFFAFWIWMIIDCATRKFKNKFEKIVWLLIVILVNWIGALIYFIVIKKFNPKGVG